jgi:hypothetical protein
MQLGLPKAMLSDANVPSPSFRKGSPAGMRITTTNYQTKTINHEERGKSPIRIRSISRVKI